MTEFAIGQTGLQLDAPSKGDVVTVRLKPCPQTEIDPTTGRSFVRDASKLPSHYRHTNIWRVVATNGNQVVVECLTADRKREVWAIGAHDWFEASELWEALAEPQSPGEAS